MGLLRLQQKEIRQLDKTAADDFFFFLVDNEEATADRPRTPGGEDYENAGLSQGRNTIS